MSDSKKILWKDNAKLVAIDGTEYSRPLFDIILFYAGAYSCEAEIDFSGDRLAQVKYKDSWRKEKTSPAASLFMLTRSQNL